MEKMTTACMQYKQKSEAYAESTLTLKRQLDTLSQELIESKMQLSDFRKATLSATTTPPPAPCDENVLTLKLQVSTLESEKIESAKQLENLNRICGELQIQVKAFESSEFEWRSEREKLVSQEKSLRETSDGLQQEVRHLKKQNDDVLSQLTQANAAKPAEVDITSLRDQINALTSDKERLVVKCQSLETMVLTQTAEINELTEAHIVFQEQEQSLVRQIVDMKDQLASQQAVASLLKNQVSTAEKQLAVVTVERDEAAQSFATERSQLEDDIKQLEQAKIALESQAVNGAAKQTQADFTIQEYNRRVDAAQAATGLCDIDFANECTKLNAQITTYKSMIESYEVELSEVKDKLAEATAELLVQRGIGDETSKRVAALESEVHRLEESTHRLHDAEATLAQLNTELSVERNSTADLRSELARTLSCVESCEAQVDKLERDLVAVGETNKEHVIRNGQLEEKIAALKGVADVEKEERERVTLELHNTTIAKATAITSLEDEVVGLRQQLDIMKQQAAMVENVEKALAQQTALVETYATDVARLDEITSDRNALLLAKRSSDATIASLRQELSTLDSKLKNVVADCDLRLGEAHSELESVKVSLVKSHDLMTEASAWKEKYDALRREADRHAMDMDSAVEEQARANANTERYKTKLDEIEGKLEETQSSLRTSQGQVQALTTEVNGHQSLAALNNAKIASLESELQTLQFQLEQARDLRSTEFEQVLADQTSKLDAQDHKLIEAQQRVTELSEENDRLKQDNVAGRDKLSSCDAAMEELRRHDESSRDKIKLLELKLKEHNDERQQAQSRMLQLEAQVRALSSVPEPSISTVQPSESAAEATMPMATSGVIILHGDASEIYVGLADEKSDPSITPSSILPVRNSTRL
ncbi:hypothetical protein DYB32_001907 [Aphanomyces invadans]|uniref:Uncharacterized protein n=1 Tax=Aphanomyces invadans TaxID=157072 RepID=A0A3R6YDP6_9STRA|nr:hypothetical protein DYB32_001907 [Aphanomyces invadans]